MRFLALILTLFHIQIYAQDTLSKAERLIAADSVKAAIELIGAIDQYDIRKQAPALKILATAHVKLRDNLAAIDVYKKLLDNSKQYYDQQNEVEALYWLTRLNAITGNFDKALDYGQQGGKMAQLQKHESWEFQINNFLSWAYFEQQINFNKVLLHEKRQAELVNRIGNETQKAHVYNNLGYDLTVAGITRLDSAINLMTYANNVYVENENNQGRWYTLMNLCWQYRLKGEYTKAIEYGQLSLKQAQADEDRHAIIEATFQLGESLIAADRVKEAAGYYALGLEQSRLKDDRDKFVFDVYYSRYLWQIGEKEQAIELLENATLFLTKSEVFYEMHGRALLAGFYFELGNIEKAQYQLEILNNPRHNYIALETKFLAATTQADIWKRNGKIQESELLISNWKDKLSATGVNMYID